jgi:hypothetical protein
MSGEQKRAITKPIAIMATVGVLVASITALNTFTGLNFRPAWGYEIEQSIAFDLKTQELLDQFLATQVETARTLMELQKSQHELQMNMIDRQKWELRKELAEHQAQERGYRNNSATVPTWLQNLVRDTETTIQKLDEERRRIERKVQEYTSFLNASNQPE